MFNYFITSNSYLNILCREKRRDVPKNNVKGRWSLRMYWALLQTAGRRYDTVLWRKLSKHILVSGQSKHMASCVSSSGHPANVQCLTIENCNKDIEGHLRNRTKFETLRWIQRRSVCSYEQVIMLRIIMKLSIVPYLISPLNLLVIGNSSLDSKFL